MVVLVAGGDGRRNVRVVPAIWVNELSVLNSPLSMPSKKKLPLSSWVMPW